MTDSNATYNVSINVDLPDFPSKVVTFMVRNFFVSGNNEVLPGTTYTLTLDANGTGTQVLPTPDNTGTLAVNWRIDLPSQEKITAAIAYSAAAQELSDILASVSTTTDPDDITAAIANKASKVSGGTTDNFVSLTAGGDMQDSGSTASDFDTAGSAAAAQAASLQISSNLGDLASTLTARDNLILNDKSSAYRLLLDRFGQPEKPATIEYIDATHNYIWTAIGSIYWLRWQAAQNGTTSVWTHEDCRIFRNLLAYNDDDSSITYTNAWGSGTPVNALGGSYQNANATNRNAEWSVTGQTEVWIAYEKRTNGGYGAITVDGGTALVSRSLSLVGSDRVIDCYAGATAVNQWIKVADNLDPTQTYTIRLTPTGTADGASSDTYVYFEGYGFPPFRMDAPQLDLVTNNSVEAISARWLEEDAGYAISYTPSGASNPELTGSDHLNTLSASIAWYDEDGSAVSVDATTTKWTSRQIRLVQTYYLRHSETGATNHATVNDTITYDYRGQNQALVIDWSSSASIGYMYAGMMPFNDGVADKGHVAGDSNTVYDLTGDDGTLYGQIASELVMLWDDTHNFVGVVDTDLSSVDWYVNSDYYTHIDDKSSGDTNKTYFRGRISQSVTSSSLWRIIYTYATYYIPSFEDYI